MFRKSSGLTRMGELRSPLLPKPTEGHLITLDNVMVQLDKKINDMRPPQDGIKPDKKSIQNAMDNIVGKTEVGLLTRFKKMSHLVTELKKNLYPITSDQMTPSEQKTNIINRNVKLIYEKFCQLERSAEKTDVYLKSKSECYDLKEISGGFTKVLNEIKEAKVNYESNEERVLDIPVQTQTRTLNK